MDGISSSNLSELSVGDSVDGNIVSLGTMRSLGPLSIGSNLRGGVTLAAGGGITELVVGGTISLAGTNPAPVTIRTRGEIYRIVAGSINANISTMNNDATFNSIHHIETTLGNFKGSLSAHRLQTLTTPPILQSTSSSPQFNIQGDLDADITLVRDVRSQFNVGGSVLSGSVITVPDGLFDTTAPGTETFTVTGDFGGALTLGAPTPPNGGAQAFNRDITIMGNLNGSITTTDSATTGGSNGDIRVNGSVNSGASITLAGDLRAGNTIRIGNNLAGIVQLPSNGLKGQVIVNANNSITPGTWTGSVKVGTTYALASGYDTVGSLLGGGAAGLAPFTLHGLDCTPVSNQIASGQGILETLINGDGATPAVRVVVRSYGRIQKANPSLPWRDMVWVMCRSYETGIDPCEWINATESFDIYGPGDTQWNSADNDGRSLGIARKSGSRIGPGIYRVELRDSRVRCVNVNQNPAVNWDNVCDNDLETVEAYVFKVAPDCDNDAVSDETTPLGPGDCSTDCAVADWNNNGTVTVQDIFDFLNHYFLGCQGFHNPSSQCWRTADVNGLSGITVQDLFDFLNAYFTVPPGGEC